MGGRRMREVSGGYSLVEVTIALALVGVFMQAGIELADRMSADSVGAIRRTQAHHLLMAALAYSGPDRVKPNTPDKGLLHPAHELVAATFPDGELLLVPGCPRWPGRGCLVIAWSPRRGQECVQPDQVTDLAGEFQCVAVPW